MDIVTKPVKRNCVTQKTKLFWEFKGRLVFIFWEKAEGRQKELTCSTQLVFNCVAFSWWTKTIKSLYSWFNKSCLGHWELRTCKLLFGGHSSKALPWVSYCSVVNGQLLGQSKLNKVQWATGRGNMGFVLMTVTVCFVLFSFFYTIKLDYLPTTLPLNFPEYDPKTFSKTAADVQLLPNIETFQLAHNRAFLVVYYLFLTDKVKTL